MAVTSVGFALVSLLHRVRDPVPLLFFSSASALSTKRQRSHERFGFFVPPPGTGPHCAPVEGRRSDRLEPLAAGAAHAARVRSGLVAARHRGRTGADDDAGARRHRLRGGVGRARHLWPLRDHRSAARLCAVRTQPDPGAGAGFLAGRRHPRRRPAAVRRRPASRRRPCGHDGGRVGDGVHPGRRGAPGLRHRASFQADPLRVHERHRADGIDQPAAQAVRLLDRERRTAEQRLGHRRRRCWTGKTNWTAFAGRRRHAGGDPAAQGQQARAGHPDRRGRRDRRRRRAGPGGARRRVGPRVRSRRACLRSPSRGSPTPISSRS